MTAPPGLAPAASTRLNEQGEVTESVSPARRVSDLMKLARTFRQLDRISNTRLSVLINTYVSQDIDRDLVSWVIGYSDPTGETAVRNVMRRAS